jgi:L-aspartate oxidase
MALRAGVACADVEFVQFHPTALAHPAMPRPLLSEALRGEGALLRDLHGARFVDELAPRDVVSAALSARMLEQGADHLWLDATGIDAFATRFPNLAEVLGAIGLDPSVDLLPVAPAAHHHCGGVLTDLDGATSIPNLWAAGEVACTGVHGANRLASNSLLEGMVFGPRVVEAVVAGRDGPAPTGAIAPLVAGAPEGVGVDRGRIRLSSLEGTKPTAAIPPPADVAKCRELLQRAMFAGAGVLRSADTLAAVTHTVETLSTPELSPDPVVRSPTPAECEVTDMLAVAAAVLQAATAREESRGAHRRSDFPSRSAAQRVRWVIQ